MGHSLCSKMAMSTSMGLHTLEKFGFSGCAKKDSGSFSDTLVPKYLKHIPGDGRIFKSIKSCCCSIKCSSRYSNTTQWSVSDILSLPLTYSHLLSLSLSPWLGGSVSLRVHLTHTVSLYPSLPSFKIWWKWALLAQAHQLSSKNTINNTCQSNTYISKFFFHGFVPPTLITGPSFLRENGEKSPFAFSTPSPDPERQREQQRKKWLLQHTEPHPPSCPWFIGRGRPNISLRYSEANISGASTPGIRERHGCGGFGAAGPNQSARGGGKTGRGASPLQALTLFSLCWQIICYAIYITHCPRELHGPPLSLTTVADLPLGYPSWEGCLGMVYLENM